MGSNEGKGEVNEKPPVILSFDGAASPFPNLNRRCYVDANGGLLRSFPFTQFNGHGMSRCLERPSLVHSDRLGEIISTQHFGDVPTA